MYHALITNFVRTLLKYRTNSSGVLLHKITKKFPTENFVVKTHDQFAVPQ